MSRRYGVFVVVCRHCPGYDMLRQKGVSGWLVAVKVDQVVHAPSINHASKGLSSFFFFATIPNRLAQPSSALFPPSPCPG